MTEPSRLLSWLIIVLLASVGVGLTVALQHATTARISAAQTQVQAQAFLSVLPASSFDNQPLQHPLALPEPTSGTATVIAAYLATLRGEPSAVLFHSQAQGYNGSIELMIAVSVSGQLLGTKVIKQSETPGIGARVITEPGWLQGFAGKSLSDPPESGWALKKDTGDFDQIAGATITSRASVDAIRATLQLFDANRAKLIVPATEVSP